MFRPLLLHHSYIVLHRHPKSAIISDVQLIFPPMSHGIGFSLAFYGLAFGATNHMMAMFDIDRFFAVLQEKEVSCTHDFLKYVVRQHDKFNLIIPAV